MTADPSIRFRWNIALGIPTGRADADAAGRAAAAQLVAADRAWLDGDVLRPLLPPHLRGLSDAPVASYYRVARAALVMLERDPDCSFHIRDLETLPG